MREQVRCTPTSSIGELFSSHVHPLHGNPYSSHHIYHMAFSPMIVLVDVSLSHPFCLPPPPSLCFAFYVSTFLLTLIHCMSAQNIERDCISLTCTWLVVWGRVQIRIQRRPSVKL